MLKKLLPWKYEHVFKQLDVYLTFNNEDIKNTIHSQLEHEITDS